MELSIAKTLFEEGDLSKISPKYHTAFKIPRPGPVMLTYTVEASRTDLDEIKGGMNTPSIGRIFTGATGDFHPELLEKESFGSSCLQIVREAGILSGEYECMIHLYTEDGLNTLEKKLDQMPH